MMTATRDFGLRISDFAFRLVDVDPDLDPRDLTAIWYLVTSRIDKKA